MRTRSGALALLLLGPLAGLACGGDDGGGPSDVGGYFEFSPYGVAACDGSDGKLEGRRELRLFSSGVVELRANSRALARYYKRHGLSFFAATADQKIAIGYALDTDNVGLTLALRRQFPGVNLDDPEALMKDPVLWDRILKATLNFMLGPMIDFARQHGMVGTGATNLVVLPQLERPGGQSIAPGGTSLAGLAISPALLALFAAMDLPEGRLWKGVDLPADFTPMMFLSNKTLNDAARGDTVVRDLVVAHEFGHTGALVHVLIDGNLMVSAVSPGRSRCTDGLDEGQLATMRTTLGVGPARAPLTLAPPPGAPAGAAGERPSHVGSLLSPARFPALLRGDRDALWALLGPLFHPIELARAAN